MRSWTPPDVYRPISRNVIVYDGPSQLTGAPILAIATAQNGNRKVGHMLQLWIIPAISPIEAVRTGADDAVCGDCRLRGAGQHHGEGGRACYVEWWRAPENIWQARDKAAQMSPSAFAELVAGLQLRIGAYGDPVAVPMAVWMPMLTAAGGWTAYSHQWRRPDAQPYRAFCMASVDSAAEQFEATALGWRTFRVRASADDALRSDEISCPASDESGHRTVCAKCELCRGQARPSKHIAIIAHGSRMKWFPSAAAAINEGVPA
jgi:hypothetical protein